MTDSGRIRDNLAFVRSRMEAACRRSGREFDSVTLIAVTKTVDVDEVRLLASLGVADFGENRVRELVRKAVALADLDARWHMIGHLQRNKTKTLLPHSTILHSLESAALAEVLSRRAAEADLEVEVLIEINVPGEESKYGIAPGDAAELALKVTELPKLKLAGLMTMAPIAANAEKVRPFFARLRDIARTLSKSLPSGAMSELSMGMTQDYEVAIEEGATMVRIGSALFR